MRTHSILLASVLAMGCGGNGTTFGDGGPSDAGGGGDTTVPPTDGSNPFGDATFGDGGACPLGCSSDLHSIIDCNNNVIQTCSGTRASTRAPRR